MAVVLGAGWELTHVTDRVLELRKSCPMYRRIAGDDGRVRVRAEPGVDRQALLERAITIAKRNDERLGEVVARQIVPSETRRFQLQRRQLASRFAIPGEEPERKVYRP